MPPLLLFLLIAENKRTKLQPQFLRRLLLTAVPGSTERLVANVIDAQDQVRAENVLVKEAITAAKVAGPEALLPSFPTLHAAFNRLSAADKAILFPPSGGGTGQGPGDQPAEDESKKPRGRS
jgi:hypothetical protein